MTREESIAIYKAHSRRLYNISYRIVRDSEEAEEIMQDTILKLITSPLRPTGDAQTAVWLSKTCIRASIDALRKKRRERAFLDEYSSWEVQSASTPEQEELAAGLDMETVRKIIGELSEPHRLILTLVLIEGLDYEEVSQYTGIKEGTIRVQYSRARAKLAERLSIIKGR